MASFSNEEGIKILHDVILAIQENKQYLSDIDGMIADGDHGVNMNKGFTMCREDLDRNPGNLAYGLNLLSRNLMMKIGGSMGPLYGKFFKSISLTIGENETIDAVLWGEALNAARESISALSTARVGDKTLVDALFPAVDAYQNALDTGKDFTAALAAMKKAAGDGRDATENMVAKIGRSSRLGERSKGVIDAGAASCALILGTMADSITEILQ
jgi:dihydroxyacetone kinase-like protein